MSAQKRRPRSITAWAVCKPNGHYRGNQYSAPELYYFPSMALVDGRTCLDDGERLVQVEIGPVRPRASRRKKGAKKA